MPLIRSLILPVSHCWLRRGFWLGAATAAIAAGSSLSAADGLDHPWQQLTMPTAAEVAATIKSPPPEWGATVTWGWDGPMSEEVIARDLDQLHARGLRVATIEAGYGMDNAPYLSDAWFKLVRFAAQEAEKRGMRLWIIDEGKYPSGFAGGKFSQERPDLRMQGIDVRERADLAAGETFDRELGPDVLGVLAVDAESGATQALPISEGRVHWTAPGQGRWQVLIVDHAFRTSVTRAVNDPTRAKTTKNSMGDLLNPEATRQIIAWTHEGYRRVLGDYFGRVVLGFRGDEPDFGSTPWNGDIVAEFQRRKNYDPRPYLPFFIPVRRSKPALALTEPQRRAKADYWDVWSHLYAANYFGLEGEWCASHGIEYVVHLNNDHNLPSLVRSTGDFFLPMQHVQIPGIDAIWNQVWPGKVADFVKFASSAAHLSGRPRALSESFAAYTPPPDIDQVRFGLNYQLVRGINLFELMFYRSSAPRAERPRPRRARPASASASGPRRRYLDDPGFPAVAEYLNRACYLLAQGRPTASIAILCPTSSFWLGYRESNDAMMRIAQQLTERQRDFDFVGDEVFADLLKVKHARLVNRSGQGYRAVIVPSAIAIPKDTLELLHEFARAGGSVIFAGRMPELVVERTFLDARPPADLSWAHREPAAELTEAILQALPAPDVRFDKHEPSVKVLHRRLRDADVYFFFNEGEAAVTCEATLAGVGQVHRWNLDSGRIERIEGIRSDDRAVTLPLTLGGYESRVFVINPTAPVVAGPAGERSSERGE